MKITSQESTTLNLVQLTRDNHEKLESLNTLKTSFRTHVEEIKYAGMTTLPFSPLRFFIFST